MNSKVQVIRWALVLGAALVPASLCRAQAQPRNGAQTEVARLDDPALPLPSGSPGDSTNTDLTPPARKADTASSPSLQDEIDAMKRRIAELELQLGYKSEPATTDASPTSTSSKSEATAALGTADSASSASSTNISDSDVSTSNPQADAGNAQSSATSSKKADPFSLYDYTWMNANSRNHDTPLATKYFSPEFRADTNYILDYNHPVDHTMGGATESFRSGEVQVEQLSFGGDLRVGNVRGRVLTMFGLFSTTTP